MPGKSGFHFYNVALAHLKLLGDFADLLGFKGFQALFHAAQIKEQFALRLGSGDFYHSPITYHELMNFSAYPVQSKGHQAHPTVWIKALYGLHESDIAFLYQIGLGQAVSGITARHTDDHA